MDSANSEIAAEKWNAALADEVSFWDRVIAENGWRWPEEHKRRLDPNSILQPKICQWLEAAEGTSVDILDVGAGPLTFVGKTWPGRTVRLTAVDPLAAEYDKMLAARNLVPPVRTIGGDVLRLSEQFGPDRFDLVYCRNAMDHCPDPIAGIRHCLHVVKPGKYVLLNHFANEAVAQNYEQLHQWNLDSENGDFVIWNRERRISVADAVRDLCDAIESSTGANRWHIAALRKRAAG